MAPGTNSLGRGICAGTLSLFHFCDRHAMLPQCRNLQLSLLTSTNRAEYKNFDEQNRNMGRMLLAVQRLTPANFLKRHSFHAVPEGGAKDP
jgi:hypothetical protein